MKSLVHSLHKLTGFTIYMCFDNQTNMLTFYNDKVYEGKCPEWMRKYITDRPATIIFEQDGRHKCYVRLSLGDGCYIVILDDDSLPMLSEAVKKLMMQETPVEMNNNASELAVLKAKIIEHTRSFQKFENEVQKLTEENAVFKEQNADQSARLAEALKKNLELSNRLRQAESLPGESAQSAEKFRASMTGLVDNNDRLKSQIKQLEEKCKKLEEQLGIETKKDTAENGNLIPLVNTLNKIIETQDASGINFSMIEKYVHVPVRLELERNPDAVKALISALVGMEKSGKLSAFQIKALNESIRK